MQRYFLIAIGGALGSVARFWVGTTVAGRMSTRFPFGTLVVNISACLIIGLSVEILSRHANLSPSWRYLIPIGFIGAYTTFSTFEYETLRAIQDGQVMTGLLNVGLSLVIGFVAVWAGAFIGRVLV